MASSTVSHHSRQTHRFHHDDNSSNGESNGSKFHVQVDDADLIGDASWKEVCISCFDHTPTQWIVILASLLTLLGGLYFFGLGLELMGNGAKVMGGCTAGELFGDETNPMVGLLTAVLATVLLQSSSTTTAIIVGLAGSEAGLISVQHGIYMIFGANLGTAVTNTLVSLSHFQDPVQLELAFSAATVHDVFNISTILVLFPIEILTGFLLKLTSMFVRAASTVEADKWEGPVKKLISPLGAKFIVANKNVINSVANGGSCDDFYPIQCDDPDNPTKISCSKVGLIACDKKSGECPAFFQATATRYDDKVSGFVVFMIGVFLIFVTLLLIVRVLQGLLIGVSTRIVYKVTNSNNYFLMIFGAGITMLLQSSSTTTSILTPFAGMGLLRMEQVFAITCGSNIGTTLTAIEAALVTDGKHALQIALAHLFFNIAGMLIWYPVLALRNIPIGIAKELGRAVLVWQGFAIVYIVTVFLALPCIGLVIFHLFTLNKPGSMVIASILSAIVLIAILFIPIWLYCWQGKIRIYNYFQERNARNRALLSLADDIEYSQLIIERLKDHTCCCEDDDDDSQPDEAIQRGCMEDYHDQQDAIANLPKDMKLVRLRLAALIKSTRMPMDDHEFDLEEGGFIEQSMIESTTVSADGSSSNNGQITLCQLLQLIPFVYLVVLLAGASITVTVLMYLFLRDAKAYHRLGSSILISLVLYGLYILHWLLFRNGIRQWFRRLFQRKRRLEAITTLRQAMATMDRDIRMIHWNLGVVKSVRSKVGKDEDVPTEKCSDYTAEKKRRK